MTRLFGAWLLLVAVVLVAHPTAQLTNSFAPNSFDAESLLGGPIPTDGTWVPFSWAMGPNVFNTAGAGTFSGAFTLQVTDASFDGDRFEVFDFGVLLGSTSVPVDDGTFQGDPDQAFADARFSSGSFTLGPGAHSITIRTTQIAVGFPNGSGFVRLIPLPPALPPGFTKAFVPATITSGGTSTLTFTIDNTANVLATTALAFAGTLPVGAVAVETPPNTANTCGGTLTADGGTGVIILSGGTVAGASICTVSVDVKSSTVGAHACTIGDLTSSAGNSGAASATLTVISAVPMLPPAGMLVLVLLLSLTSALLLRRRRLV